jgi:chemotaxis protein CheX
MASKMLGVEPEAVEEHIYDAVGEVCNMVAGNFKNKLTGISDKCMLSVPTVITGSDYCYHTLSDKGSLQLVVLFEGSRIMLSLELHS